MISYAPAPAVQRRVVLAQVAPPVVAAPAPASSPFINLIGWTVLGIATGALSGYGVGKGLGNRNTPLQDAVIGGIGGGAATLLAKIL